METQEPDIAPLEVATPAPKKRKGKWRRRITRTVGVVLGVPLFLILLLQFSFSQTFLAGFALDWVSNKIEFKTEAKSIHLNLFTNTLTLHNVQILDRQGKTMIAVEQLKVAFDYSTVLKNGDVYLKEVLLKRGAINLIWDKTTNHLNIEEFIERIDELTASKEPRKNKPPSVFTIGKAKLEDVFFTYNDTRKPYAKGEEIDFAHFGLDHLDGELHHLRIVADTVEIELRHLKAQEHKTALPIHDLTAHFFMTRQKMEFRNLHLAMGKSVLRNQLFMQYNSQKDLSDFVEKVTLVAHLDSTVLDTRDLQLFAPAVKRYKDTWHINGILRGRVNNFVFDDLQLGWGKGSTWRGRAAMQGLPDIDSTHMNLDFREAKLISKDLLQYVDQEDANEILERLGEVAIFKGAYKGTIQDFEAGGSFETSLGEFDAQMRLALGDGSRPPYYKAKVSTPDLHVGTLLGIDDLKNVAIEGDVEGTGFTPETAQLTLDTKVKFAEYNRYRYQNIEVKGKVSHQRFEGVATSTDPNFDFELDGIIDFHPVAKSKDKPAGRFELDNAQIRNINLQALNFTKDRTIIKGVLSADLSGLHIDSLVGYATLRESAITLKDKTLKTGELGLYAYKHSPTERQFMVQTDYFTANAAGKFHFSDMVEDLPTLAYEYALSFENNQKNLDNYYKKKQKLHKKDYKMEFDATLFKIDSLFWFLDVPLHISPETEVKGEFIQHNTAQLNIDVDKPIKELFYGATKLFNTTFEVKSSKYSLSRDVLANIKFDGKKQHLGGMDFANTNIEATWWQDDIEFIAKTEQADSPNKADLIGTLNLQDGNKQLHLNECNLKFYNDIWGIDKNNNIKLTPWATILESVVFKNKNRTSQISAIGTISDSIATPLQVDLKQIDIGSFAQVFKIDANGTLNGQFTLANLTKKPDIQGELAVENLMYREMLVGDVDGKVRWLDDQEKLDLDFTGFRKGRYILSLMGGIYPNKKDDALDLEAKFNRTDLEIFEPFADEFVSRLRGNLLGKVFIKGKLSEPQLTGKVKINNGSFKFNLLNTHYDVEGDINLRKDEIVANNIALSDEQSNPTTITFKLFHDNFKNFYVDTDMRFYHGFQVMNNEATPNCMYYGKAFASGEAKIRGTLDNLSMNIRAKSSKGTQIFLPLDGYQEVGAKDYIHFVTNNKKDSLAIPKINLGGMRLKFNLDVTPQAEFDIIIDSRTGDKITAKGKGNIVMDISKEGDFSIRGKYLIQQGKYKFTFANLINKDFKIAPNSSIQFNGDVYETQLDVRAMYEASVPLRSLVDINRVTDANSPEYRRPYPVKATLDLKGALFSPELKMGLELPDERLVQNNNLRSALLQIKALVANDEQERNRQVFSLLVLNQLMQPNAFAVTGAAAGSSISEMLSNQFSNWISQVDEDLELSFNVNDVTNIGSYQLRVSYSFLDGRLRLTRDGGFTNAQNQAEVSNILGDWTLEYLLTENGKWRVKTYRRNNTGIAGGSNATSNLNAANTATMGASIMYTASFDRLAEMFIRGRKNAGGLRTNEDTEQVIMKLEENVEDEIPQEYAKKDTEIVEEDKFPLRHRIDTLREVHKSLPKPIIEASKFVVYVSPIKHKEIDPSALVKEPQNVSIDDPDNEDMPNQYKKDKSPTNNNHTTPTHNTKHDKHFIFYQGKNKTDAPLLHRYGR